MSTPAAASPAEPIRACPCCGLAQIVPVVDARSRACCARCGCTLFSPLARYRSNSRTAAIALSGLILYPLGVMLPIMRIERMGHASETSILDGTAALLSHGHIVVGVVVLMCSVILPAAKLLALLTLTVGDLLLPRSHRASIYRAVEFTGRWGMLDVLAVAVLVAAVKLGETVELTPGPGAAAFTAVVVLSLLASASFDPHALWERTETDSAGASQNQPSKGATRST